MRHHKKMTRVAISLLVIGSYMGTELLWAMEAGKSELSYIEINEEEAGAQGATEDKIAENDEIIESEEIVLGEEETVQSGEEVVLEEEEAVQGEEIAPGEEETVQGEETAPGEEDMVQGEETASGEEIAPGEEDTVQSGEGMVQGDSSQENQEFGNEMPGNVGGENIIDENKNLLENWEGYYYDWSNVPKTTLSHTHLNEVAAVWQQDYLYLYVLENDLSGNACSFTWNTYFEWTSDHGIPISFKANISNWEEEPKRLSIQGYKGAEGIGTKIGEAYLWEMKFPVSELGNQINNVSLKWYQGEDSILELENPSGEVSKPEQKPDDDIWGDGNINIDGYFEDWDHIPHGRLTYNAWNGTCEHHGALYVEDKMIYGHIKMDDLYGNQMPMNSFYLNINGKTVQFSTHYRAADNSIDWGMDSQIYNMPEGISEGLGLFIDGYPPYYLGEAVLNVRDGQSHSEGDEFEFAINLETLSMALGTPIESMTQFKLTAPNIGAGSISAYGTSTGPLLGLLICIGGLGGYSLLKKKKETIYE